MGDTGIAVSQIIDVLRAMEITQLGPYLIDRLGRFGDRRLAEIIGRLAQIGPRRYEDLYTCSSSAEACTAPAISSAAAILLNPKRTDFILLFSHGDKDNETIPS